MKSIKIFVFLGLVFVGQVILFLIPTGFEPAPLSLLILYIGLFTLYSIILLPIVISIDFKNKKGISKFLWLGVILGIIFIPSLFQEFNQSGDAAFDGLWALPILVLLIFFVVSMIACFIFGKMFSFIFTKYSSGRKYFTIAFILLSLLLFVGTMSDLNTFNKKESFVNLDPIVSSLKDTFPRYFDFENKSGFSTEIQPLLIWAGPKIHAVCNQRFISPARRLDCYRQISAPHSDGLLQRTIWSDRRSGINSALAYVEIPIKNCTDYSSVDYILTTNCLTTLAKKEKDARICFVITEHYADPNLYNSCMINSQ